ncbi:MAG: redoxin family protein [Pirellulales bacterium]
MSRLLPPLLLWIILPVAVVAADEPLNVATEFGRLNAELNEAVSKGGRDQKVYAKAQVEFKAGLEKLVARAEQEKSQEHGPLATAYQRLNRYDDAVREAKAAIAEQPKSVVPHTVLISSLGFSGKPDEAEQAFEAALKAIPDNPSLEGMRQSLAFAYQRAGKYDKAGEHLTTYIESAWPQVQNNPNAAANFRNLISSLAETGVRGKRAAETLPAVEKFVKQAQEAAAKNDKFVALVAGAREAQIRLMVAAERTDDAAKLIGDELAALEKNDKPDLSAIVAIAELKRLQIQLAGFGPQRIAAIDAFYDHLNSRWEMAKTSGRYVELAGDAAQQKAQALVQTDKLEEADQLLTSWQQRLKELKADDPAVTATVPAILNGIGYLRQRLEGELKRKALVGKPYFPILEATWLNGSPLKPEELRGKVVLLDFWAVWCGPCIATFPHLREWNEKYADKGLVIVGVTRHYEYGWDAEAKRGKREEGISKADEDKATTEFVKHHELKHRIAVMPDNDLSAKYLVTGIPQAVLIDRDGSIRMIRVGSGEANAQMLEQAIRQLTGANEQAAVEK